MDVYASWWVMMWTCLLLGVVHERVCTRVCLCVTMGDGIMSERNSIEEKRRERQQKKTNETNKGKGKKKDDEILNKGER